MDGGTRLTNHFLSKNIIAWTARTSQRKCDITHRRRCRHRLQAASPPKWVVRHFLDKRRSSTSPEALSIIRSVEGLSNEASEFEEVPLPLRGFALTFIYRAQRPLTLPSTSGVLANASIRKMQLEILSSRVGKLCVKVIALAGAFLALSLLFVVAWGGGYPSYDPNPPILLPKQGEVWHVGELHTVQWSVDSIPTTNSSGKPVLALLILAYWSNSNEPALLKHEPLTDWIPITDKMANVIVPAVPTRSDYSIFLNAHDDRSSCSGTITIFNPDDPTGTGAPPRTLLVTTAPPISSTVSFPPSTPMAQTFSANTTSASPSAAEASTTSTSNVTLSPRRAGSSIPSGADHAIIRLCESIVLFLAVMISVLNSL
ncbi:hypothetical protein NUW54_g8506 [Trametes sanguinea]|uniref:Uncharacterized protein n=1 Tax=Trametes sanguinea TaxID=158606 RepID=A0ACC1PDV5_9APHY|nr:hypothetical protein NUW54_g8506 [Trametes sanguinea]